MPAPEDNSGVLAAADEIREYEYTRGFTAGTEESADRITALTTERDAIKAEYDAHMATHPKPEEPDPEPEPEPPTGKFPLVPALALNPKDDANYNSLKALGVDESWFLRAYHGGAFKPIDQFAWAKWMKGKFSGLIFSTQHGTSDASYAATARGEHDEMWKRIVDSWPDGMPGGINLGNEMNLEPVKAEIYRDAIEYLIGKFELPDHVYWTLAYSNFKSWTNAGRRQDPGHQGEKYLPRTDKRILVLTHTYGKDQWPDPVAQQSMFHAEMDKHPTWLRGGGESSAQENPRDKDAKANYLVGAGKAMKAGGGSVFTFFDSGTNGSDEIASTPHTAAAIKAWTDTLKNNDWS